MYYVFLSDKQLTKNFFDQYIFITICIVTSIIGIVLFRRTENAQVLALPTIGFLAIMFLFIDSIGEEADIYHTNPAGFFLLIVIQPFYVYIGSFLKRHTRLIGLGITLKQQESINSFITEVSLKKIKLMPEHPGYAFLQIYENYTWSVFFNNFYNFFVHRHVPKSRIHLHNGDD